MIRLALLVLFGTTLVSAQDGVELRAAVTSEADGDTDGMRRSQLGGLEVWIGETVATFEPQDIQSVGLEVDDGGGAAVSVWLEGDAAARLAQVTASRSGSALAVLHRGTLLSAPRIEGGVANGLVMIAGLDAAEARRVARSLRERIGIVEGTSSEPARPLPPRRDREPPRADPPSPRPAAAPDLDAGDTAQAFVDAVSRRQWGRVADLLHPDSWAAVRPDAVAMLRFDGPTVRVQDGDARASFAAADVLGTSADRAPASQPDRP